MSDSDSEQYLLWPQQQRLEKLQCFAKLLSLHLEDASVGGTEELVVLKLKVIEAIAQAARCKTEGDLVVLEAAMCEALGAVPGIIEQLQPKSAFRCVQWLCFLVRPCYEPVPDTVYRFVPSVLAIMGRPTVTLHTVHVCCNLLYKVLSGRRDPPVDFEAITPVVVDAILRVLASVATWQPHVRKEFASSCCNVLRALEFSDSNLGGVVRPFVSGKPSLCLAIVQPLCKLVVQSSKHRPYSWFVDATEVFHYFALLARTTANHEALKSPTQGCVVVLTSFMKLAVLEAGATRDLEVVRDIRCAMRQMYKCAWTLYKDSDEFGVDDVQCLDALAGLYSSKAYEHDGCLVIWHAIRAKVEQAREQRRRWERCWTPLRAGWIGAVACHQAALADTLAAEAALEAALVGEDSDSDSDSGCARKRVRSA
jgi:hypothetical protein